MTGKIRLSHTACVMVTFTRRKWVGIATKLFAFDALIFLDERPARKSWLYQRAIHRTAF